MRDEDADPSPGDECPVCEEQGFGRMAEREEQMGRRWEEGRWMRKAGRNGGYGGYGGGRY